jgi:hypothetical protein
MSGVAGRSGRRKFVPTPDHRDLVTLLATRDLPDREHSSVVGLLADEPVTSRILPFVPEKRAASGPRCRPRPIPPAHGHRW